ncbi:DNA polymerase III, gamma tau subunit [Secundilactobacillus odoratitofui DSM 19909 = JCM 15043]|uniref:DNA-directed DNA polymerase n=1 Tax=Secundilactobacillus odoratitofui DSM 19909 = JCM 15043 TaxID=1423776 RepID=A0A0R1M4D2_9LACO|nr:DNA polymerase III subunit gamma/tau [Secundilactobacillus odoratitofui]KRK99937.1 DNA polymerase III, gamma tau subunit [Secundilactobacillus odoratitofui DSM 19909 = JCM 15043]
MSYQALYRVWRPQRFDEVIGQTLVTQTLKNAIKTKQTSHAYLFAGPRGTGKTSMAKIFAKAVNCRHQQDGEPCNECETCQAITKGTLNDVIEIDAASNNGVEEIRDIRDKVKYAPTEADYKVYIIDEVHMLSTGAFNALLKTLEEPPANVIFILATTEPHKIPATIISRTQRFDFKQIQAKDSLARMAHILDEKKLSYDDEALKVIAKASEGGMRDALSILDQVISFGDETVTLDNALLVTGAVRKQLLVDYLTQVTTQQTQQALMTVQAVLADGKDPERFTEDLVNLARDLLLYRQSPELVTQIEMDQVDESFKKLASSVTPEQLYQTIDDLNDIQQQMRFTTHEDVYLEVLTVRLAGTPQSTPIAAAPTSQADAGELERLMAEVRQLKQTVQKLEQAPTVSSPAKPVTSTPKPTAKRSQVNLGQVYPILGAATRQDLSALQEVWGDLMNMLSIPQRSVMGVSKPVAASEDGAIIAFDNAFMQEHANGDQELIDALENGLDRLMHKVPKIVFVPIDQWPQIRKTYIQQHKVTGQSKPAAETNHDDEQTSASAETQPATKTEVVEKAEQLFGEDVVEVKTD